MSTLREIIPSLYSKFLDRRALQLDVTETKATCDNCLRSRDRRFPYLYKPDLKCCTFQPFLPNYAVGGILAKKLKGAGVIKEMIHRRSYSLPLGIAPTLEYQYRFYTKKKTDFGNREDLLCAYYDKENQNCSVWEFRGSVCTTFYCRSDRGQKGQDFWTATNDYFSYVEMALAEECLVQLDFSPRDISDQLSFLNRKTWSQSEKNKKSMTSSEFKQTWNGYDKIEDFYIKCYELVIAMEAKNSYEVFGEIETRLRDRMKKAGLTQKSHDQYTK